MVCSECYPWGRVHCHAKGTAEFGDRAGVELLIKQLKRDYALGSIPTRHFFATETYF
jgi:hypothetical protein